MTDRAHAAMAERSRSPSAPDQVEEILITSLVCSTSRNCHRASRADKPSDRHPTTSLGRLAGFDARSWLAFGLKTRRFVRRRTSRRHSALERAMPEEQDGDAGSHGVCSLPGAAATSLGGVSLAFRGQLYSWMPLGRQPGPNTECERPGLFSLVSALVRAPSCSRFVAHTLRMRALTIRQPWASLIVFGEKDVENRTWTTRHRGSLAIHAGQAVDHDLQAWQLNIAQRINTFPRGAIVGIVDLRDVVRDSRSRWAEPGHHHWVLTDPRPIEPVPMRGRLGLWTPDVEISSFPTFTGCEGSRAP